MATAFNLTAQLNIQGPGNLKPVIGKIKRELNTIKSGGIDFKMDNNSIKGIRSATKYLAAMNVQLKDSAKYSTTLSQNMASLSGSLNRVASASKSSSSGLGKVTKDAEKLKDKTEEAGSALEQLFANFNSPAVTKSLAFSVVYRGLNLLTGALVEGRDQFIRYEKALNRLQQIGRTSRAIADVDKQIRQLSTNLGVSSGKLADASITLAQAGFSAKEASASLKVLAETDLSATFNSIEQTTEGLIAIKNQFSLTSDEIRTALDSINAVSKRFAIESSDLIAAAQRTGGVFAAAAGDNKPAIRSLQEFAGIITTVRDTTRETAETIATGVKTITGRLQRLSTATFIFKELGVNIRDANGEFIGTFEALQKISEAIQDKGITTGSKQFARIVEQVGGIRQIGKVIPLLTQFQKAQEAVTVAQQGAGSIAKDAALGQQTFEASIVRVKEAFFDLTAAISDSGIGALTKGLLETVAAALKLAKVFAPLAPILLLRGGLNLASGKGLFGGGSGGLGLGGGGGGGGGGAGPQGTQDEQKTQQNTQAVTSNTQATADQTAATNNLIQVLNDFETKALNEGVPAFAKGGTVRKFASGGFVPGSGNRDTVPAMLTPGEFVIRKKAVETIGASNLESINRKGYNSGGSVYSKDAVGALILGKKGGTRESSVSDSIIDKQLILSQFSSESQKQDYEILNDFIPDSKTWKVLKQAAGPKVRSSVDKSIERASVVGYNQMVQDLKASIFPEIESIGLRDKTNTESFTKALNDATRGNLYEQLLTGVENQGTWDTNPDPRANFDFVGPFKSESLNKIYDRVGFLTYKDAKATADAANDKNFANKIGNQILKEGREEYGFDKQSDIYKDNFDVKPKDPISDNIQKLQEVYSSRIQEGQTGVAMQAAELREILGMSTAGKIPTSIRGFRITEQLPKKPGGKRYSIEAQAEERFMAGGYASSKPPSPKQLGFLKKLVEENGVPEGFEYPPKTSAQASALIDRIKNPPKQGLDLNSLFKEYQQIFGVAHPQANEQFEEEEIAAWAQNIDRTIEKYNKFANVIKEYYGKIIQQDSYNGSFYALGGPNPRMPKRAELDRFVSGGFDRKLLEEFGQRGDLAFGSSVNAPRGRSANSSALRTRKTYMRGYAEGGAAEDTVPALLTPGEFVINKKAAARIGSSNLERLNRADKIQGFNKGGSVGFVQRFAVGGGVDPVRAEGMAELLQTIQQSGSYGSDLAQIARNLNIEVGTRLKETVSATADAGQSYLLVNKNLIKIMENLGVEAQTLAKVFSGSVDSVDDAKENIKMFARATKQTAEAEQKAQSDKIRSMKKLDGEAPSLMGHIQEPKTTLISKYDNLVDKMNQKVKKATDSFSEMTSKVSPFAKRIAGVGALLAGINHFEESLRTLTQNSEAASAALGAVKGGLQGFLQGTAGAKALGFNDKAATGIGIALAVSSAINEGLKAYLETSLNKMVASIEKSNSTFEKSVDRLEKAIKSDIAYRKAQVAGGEAVLENARLGDVYNQTRVGPGLQLAAGAGGVAAGLITAGILAQLIPAVGQVVGTALIIGGVAGGALGYGAAGTVGANQGAQAEAYAQAGEKQMELFSRLGTVALERMPLDELREMADESNNASVTLDEYVKSLKAVGVANAGIIAEQELGLASYAAMRKKQGASIEQIEAEIRKNRGESIRVGLEQVRADDLLRAQQQQLLREQQLLAIQIDATVYELTRLGDALTQVDASIKLIAERADRIEAGRQGSISGALQFGGGREREVLDNPSAFSGDEVRRATLAITQPVYGVDESERIAKLAQAQNTLEVTLPRLLREAGDDDDARNKALSTVQGLLETQGMTPDQVKIIIDKLEDTLNKNADKDVDTLLDDLGPEIQNISRATKAAIDKAKQASEILTRELNRAGQALDKFYAAAKRATEYQMKAIDIRYRAEVDLAQAMGNELSLEQLGAGTTAQLNALLAPVVNRGDIRGGDLSAAALASTILTAQNSLSGFQQEVEDQRAAFANAQTDEAIAATTSGLFAAVEAQAQNIDSINRARQALEYIANDGSKAAAALAKIQEQQQRFRNLANFGRQLVTNDPLQNAELLRNLQMMNQAIAGNPEVTQNPALLSNAFQGFDAIKDLLPQNKRNEVEAELLKQSFEARGITEIAGTPVQDIIESIKGRVDPEDKLVKAYNDAVQEQVRAQFELSRIESIEAQAQLLTLVDIHKTLLSLPEEIAKAQEEAQKQSVEELTKARDNAVYSNAELDAKVADAEVGVAQAQERAGEAEISRTTQINTENAIRAATGRRFMTPEEEEDFTANRMRGREEYRQIKEELGLAEAALVRAKFEQEQDRVIGQRELEADYDRRIEERKNEIYERQKAQEEAEKRAREAEAEARRQAAEAEERYMNRFQFRMEADVANAGIVQERAKGGLIYANNGTFVPRGTDTVPAMLTPGEFVMNRDAVKKHGVGMMNYLNDGGEPSKEKKEYGSIIPLPLDLGEGVSILGSALGSGGNPLTLRNTGAFIDNQFGLEGGYFTAAGDLADVGVASAVKGRTLLQGGATAGATTAGAATAGGVAYAGLYLTDLARQAAEYINDPEAKVQQIYEENRRQAAQGYAQNVGENLVNPGRATAQLVQEGAGLYDDSKTLAAAEERTSRMQRARHMRIIQEQRAADPDGLTRSERQMLDLQDMMQRSDLSSQRRRVYGFAKGGLVNYLADGGQPTLDRKSAEDQIVTEARRNGIMRENETIDAFLRRTRGSEYSLFQNFVETDSEGNQQTERRYVGGTMDMAAMTRAQLLKIRRTSRTSERLGIGFLDAQILDNTRNKDPKFYNNTYGPKKLTGGGHTAEQVAQMQEKRKEILAGIRERRTNERRAKKGTGNAAYDQMMARRREAYGQMMAQRRAAHQARFPGYYSQGSMIPFEPKGTDTVPAMLTPGEFVINKESTKKYRGLIEKINNGTLYAANGAEVPGVNNSTNNRNSYSLDSRAFNDSVVLFQDSVVNFGVFVESFGNYVGQLQAIELPTIPDRIEMVGNHNVNVTVTGAAAFESLEESTRRLINESIDNEMAKLWDQSNGSLGRARNL